MSTDNRFLLIRNFNLWSHLTDAEYDELDIVHHYIEAKKGDYIYFDSHQLRKLFFVKGGYIKIGYIDDTGNEIIKEIINEGEIFGQFSLEENDLNGEFAQAHKGDVSLCAFNITDFEQLLQSKPQIAIAFSKKVGNKLRNAEFRLLNMLHKDVRSRLLGFFYHLAETNGHDPENESFTMENFLTHDDIARLIGSSRQTVTSMLNEISSEGLVFVNRQEIHIPDVKKLQKLVIVT